MLYCPECGSPLNEGAIFCPVCGYAATGERRAEENVSFEIPVTDNSPYSEKVFVETEVVRTEINYSGATIYRKGSVRLSTGDNRIYLKLGLGAPRNESVIIEFEEPVGSCNVSAQEIIAPEITGEEEDNIRDLQKKIAGIEAKESIYNAQEAAYRKNSDFSSRTNVTVAESLEYMAKLPELLSEITEKLSGLASEKEELTKEIEKIRNAERKSFGVIPVDVYAPAEGEFHFTFHYYESMVQWKPFYEIRVTNLSSPLSFAMKGTIEQKTGEDWNDVDTVLICGNLSSTNVQPKLNPWRLDFRRTESYGIPRPQMAMMSAPMAGASARTITLKESASVEDTAVLPRPKSEKKSMETMESYVLSAKQKIKAGKGTIVDITDFTIPAEYIYTTTPKLDPEVFLTARIRDIGVYNLYRCDAALYLGGTYIGRTRLDPDPTKEYFELSLGKDSQISVSRTNTRKYTERHSRKTEHMAYEYEIRIISHKCEPVVIQIKDQIPVSANQEIVIEGVETTQGVLDPQTGEVTWCYTFQPDMPALLKLGYSIIWPKGKQLNM